MTLRVLLATLSVFTLGTTVTAMFLFLKARHLEPPAVVFSTSAAVVGMSGVLAFLVTFAVFRVQDLTNDAPVSWHDFLPVPGVILVLISGLLLVRDLGKVLGMTEVESMLAGEVKADG